MAESSGSRREHRMQVSPLPKRVRKTKVYQSSSCPPPRVPIGAVKKEFEGPPPPGFQSFLKRKSAPVNYPRSDNPKLRKEYSPGRSKYDAAKVYQQEVERKRKEDKVHEEYQKQVARMNAEALQRRRQSKEEEGKTWSEHYAEEVEKKEG